MMRVHALVVSLAAVLGLASLAWACNVPVFRFAIERWQPDPYRAILLHRGPLTEADRELLKPLEEQEEGGLANLTVRTVDVGELDASSEFTDADKALWQALGESSLPVLVVHYPRQLNIPQPVFAAPPERAAIARLTDSPARKELTKRLAAGQTAVWVLLEGSQEEQNETAAALLEAELKKLEQDLELPELTAAPEDALLSEAPLKIEFSLLRVQRDDPAEQTLAAMLIHSESDLAERTEPMVFPVFGRGRGLWGLIGPGITESNIRDSASFLVGACSCEVKEQNPGFDLLLAADWDDLLSQGGFKFTAAETKLTDPPAETELVPIPTGAQPAAAGTSHTIVVSQTVHSYGPAVPFWIIIGGVGALALLGIAAIAVFVAASQGSRPAD